MYNTALKKRLRVEIELLVDKLKSIFKQTFVSNGINEYMFGIESGLKSIIYEAIILRVSKVKNNTSPLYIHKCAYIYIYAQKYTYAHIHIQIHTHAYTYIYIYIHT